MAVALHRFPLSHYSEKVRLALVLKGIDHLLVDHSIGVDQRKIYRLSGQRQVPVLEHNGDTVHDSTAIAMYLEHAYPPSSGRPALLPEDFIARREALDLEDRLDRAFENTTRVMVLHHVLRDERYRHGVLRASSPKTSSLAVAALGLSAMTLRVGTLLPSARHAFDTALGSLRETFIDLVERLARQPYLMGEKPGLVDVTAAGLSLLLEVPEEIPLPDGAIKGLGIPEFLNDPAVVPFFLWRRKFYKDLHAGVFSQG